jgi:protein required for attachment to host cells
MVRKTITWILVADGNRARVLIHEGPGKGLKHSTDPELSRDLPPTHEFGTDRPGRVQESGYSGRHAIEPRLDWHRHEKHLFARAIAQMLDENAAHKAFDRLILIAPPQTLGALRASLGKATLATISGELPKDLTHTPIGDMPNHLRELIAL